MLVAFQEVHMKKSTVVVCYRCKHKHKIGERDLGGKDYETTCPFCCAYEFVSLSKALKLFGEVL